MTKSCRFSDKKLIEDVTSLKKSKKIDNDDLIDLFDLIMIKFTNFSILLR